MFSVHTCFNKAGRLSYQVPSIKTKISSDLIMIIKNEKVIKKIQKCFFLHTLQIKRKIEKGDSKKRGSDYGS